MPIPASQCALHSPRLAAQWRGGPSLRREQLDGVVVAPLLHGAQADRLRPGGFLQLPATVHVTTYPCPGDVCLGS